MKHLAAPSRRQAGFTIIEFMIAMTLSLLVLAALTAAFVASSRSRTEIERANEQIENGRFALQILTDDLEMAGFLSHFDLDIALAADTPLPIPAAKPDPCSAALADLRLGLAMHIQGYDSPEAGDEPACLTDFKAGTDIVVVRRTATCVDGTTNCATPAGAPLFQSSLCSGAGELADLTAANYYRLDTTVGNLNRTQRNCVTVADRRQYLTHIYFIAENDQAGDGIPTLMRAELGNAADPGGFTIVPLAHGIQDLQLEYGIDTDNNGSPNAFTTDPDIYDPPGGAAGPFADCAAHNSECISNWRNVIAVRLNLLARNSAVTRDHVDTKVYSLGLNNDGTIRCALDANDDGTCEAFSDGFKRHVYQTSVRLNNPAGRRE